MNTVKSKRRNRSAACITKCQDLRCGTFLYIKTGQKFNLSGKEFTINNDMSCHTRNLIYVISLIVENFILETGNTLREQIRINKQHINSLEYRKKNSVNIWTYCGKKSLTKCASLMLLKDEKKKSIKPQLNSFFVTSMHHLICY